MSSFPPRFRPSLHPIRLLLNKWASFLFFFAAAKKRDGLIRLMNRRTCTHVSSPLRIWGKTVFPEYSLLPNLPRRCQVLRQPMPDSRPYHAVGKSQRLRGKARRRIEWTAAVLLSKHSKPTLIKVPHDAGGMWRKTVWVQFKMLKKKKHEDDKT